MVYQTETDKLTPIALSGLDISDFRRLESNVEKSLFRTVFDTQESVIISRLSLEPTLDFLYKNTTETSLYILPITIGKKCFRRFYSGIFVIVKISILKKQNYFFQSLLRLFHRRSKLRKQFLENGKNWQMKTRICGRN